MISKVYSAASHGIEGLIVDVECYCQGNTPRFDIIGLPDTAVKESYNRIKAAIKTSGYMYPVANVTINLAPANINKHVRATILLRLFPYSSVRIFCAILTRKENALSAR